MSASLDRLEFDGKAVTRESRPMRKEKRLRTARLLEGRIDGYRNSEPEESDETRKW